MAFTNVGSGAAFLFLLTVIILNPRGQKYRLYTFLTSAAAFFGTAALFSLTDRLDEYRHITALAFFPLFLLNAGELYSAAPDCEESKLREYAAGPLSFLLIASLCSGFLYNFSFALRDIKGPFSENKIIARFLIENGYDAPDVMILSSRADLDSTIKAYMPNVGTFRTVENMIPYDLTYAAWQLRSAFAPMGSEDVLTFAKNQTEANKSNYRAIIFLLPIYSSFTKSCDYKLIFESPGGTFDTHMEANVYLTAENGVIQKENRNDPKN